jgi:signal transduction histidine kinase
MYTFLALFAALLALIVTLLIQRARRRRAEQLTRSSEARNSAILRAIPDLMFVLRRDGTYVDFHVRDPKALFVAPDQFMGKRISDVLPAPVAGKLMDGLGRACESGEPVVVEYELEMGERRFYEARMVRVEADLILTIVRDVTEARRASTRNRDLAGRLIASQEEERTRIARDLHDGVCQDVAAISVDLTHLRQTPGSIQSGEVQDVLSSLQRRTGSLAESLRLLSHGLHSSVLHHVGLVAALQSHCAEVERQHHVEVTFAVDGDVEPADRSTALSLFRIAQEALGNAVRHGRARHARVTLGLTAHHLRLEVVDDGDGFDLAHARQNGGLGLVSMEERARLVHGDVTIESSPGFGTAVLVRIPAEVVGAHTVLAGATSAAARRA